MASNTRWCSLLMMFTLTLSMQAQSWQRSITVNGGETRIVASGLCSDGGAIVAGFDEMDSLFYARLDSDGSYQWSYRAPHSFPNHIAEDKNGGYFYVGTYQGNVLVHRFNDTGSIAWGIKFTLLPAHLGISAFADQGLSGANHEHYDYLLTFTNSAKECINTRLDHTGTVLWYDDHAGLGDYYAGYAVAAAMDGGSLVAGHGPDGPLTIERYNDDGTHAWLYRYLQADQSFPIEPVILENGDSTFLVAAAFGYTNSNLGAPAGLVKFAADGSVLWAKYYHFNNDLWTVDLAPSGQNFVLLAQSSVYANTPQPMYEWRSVMLELDPSGDLIRSRILPSRGFRNLNAPIQDQDVWKKQLHSIPDGSLLRSSCVVDSTLMDTVGVITRSFIHEHWGCWLDSIAITEMPLTLTQQPFFKENYTSPPVSDQTITLTYVPGNTYQRCSSTLTNTEEVLDNSMVLLIQPIPAKNNIWIRWQTPANEAIIALMSITGKVLKPSIISIGPNEAMLDVTGLVPGMYVVHVTLNGNVHVTKVLIGEW